MLKKFIITYICLIGVSISNANQCLDLFGPSSLSRALGLIESLPIARKLYFKDWLDSLKFYETNNFVFPKEAHFRVLLKVQDGQSAKEELEEIKAKFPYSTDSSRQESIEFFIPAHRASEFLTLLSTSANKLDPKEMIFISGLELRSRSENVQLEKSDEQSHDLGITQALQIQSLKRLGNAQLSVPLNPSKSESMNVLIYYNDLGWNDIRVSKKLTIKHNYPKNYDELIARGISEGLYQTAYRKSIKRGISVVTEVEVSVRSIEIDSTTNLPTEIILDYSVIGHTNEDQPQNLEVKSTATVVFQGNSITNPHVSR